MAALHEGHRQGRPGDTPRPDRLTVIVPTRIDAHPESHGCETICPSCDGAGFVVSYSCGGNRSYRLVVCHDCRELLDIETSTDGKGHTTSPTEPNPAAATKEFDLKGSDPERSPRRESAISPPPEAVRLKYFKACLEWGEKRGRLVRGRVWKPERVPYISIRALRGDQPNIYYGLECDQPRRVNVGLMVQFAKLARWKPILEGERAKVESLRTEGETPVWVDESDPKRWCIFFSRLDCDLHDEGDYDRQFRWAYDALDRMRTVYNPVIAREAGHLYTWDEGS